MADRRAGDELTITNIERRNPAKVEGEGDGGVGTTSVVVFYDVTLVQWDGEEYGPIIITGFRDLRPEIMDMVAGGSSRTYLVLGFWCYDEDGEDTIDDDAYVMCSANMQLLVFTLLLEPTRRVKK